jgi:hypothetical protein
MKREEARLRELGIEALEGIMGDRAPRAELAACF